jgi:2-hydroxy-3-oxopropionate reductase
MKTIGFIGVGTMGNPMAARLIRAGFDVVAMDVRISAVQSIVEVGARAANTYADLASSADVIVLCLPNSETVESVVYSPGNLLHAVQVESVLIDMGTSDPESTRRIAADLLERDVYMLDAPVSGGEKGAEQGTLSCMVGGDEHVYFEAKSILSELASTIRYVGESGMGHSMKLLNNMVGVTNLLILCEVFSVAERLGVDLELALDVLAGGSAQSRAMDFWGQRLVKKDYQHPTYRYDLAAKDMRMAMSLAIQSGAPLPIFSATNLLFSIGTSMGFMDQDISIVKKFWDDLI